MKRIICAAVTILELIFNTNICVNRSQNANKHVLREEYTQTEEISIKETTTEIIEGINEGIQAVWNSIYNEEEEQVTTLGRIIIIILSIGIAFIIIRLILALIKGVL